MKEQFKFDEFEKKILDDKTEQMLAIEFYREIVDHFKWHDVYQVVSKWNNIPSLNIKIGNKNIEFAFGGGSLRIACRTIFMVKIDDHCFGAIQKILDVLDYLGDEPSSDQAWVASASLSKTMGK